MRRAPRSDDERAKWAQQLGCRALKDNRGWCCKAHLIDKQFAGDMLSTSSIDNAAPAQSALEVEESDEYIIVSKQLLEKAFQE